MWHAIESAAVTDAQLAVSGWIVMALVVVFIVLAESRTK